MINWIINFVKPKPRYFYSQKCTQDVHIMPTYTPTLGRRIIGITDQPCHCGLYKNTAEFLQKQSSLLAEIVQNNQNNKGKN